MPDNVRICGSCGSALPGGAKFCGNCGGRSTQDSLTHSGERSLVLHPQKAETTEHPCKFCGEPFRSLYGRSATVCAACGKRQNTGTVVAWVAGVLIGAFLLLYVVAQVTYDPKAAHQREVDDAKVSCSYNIPEVYNQSEESRQKYIDMCAEMAVGLKNVNTGR